MPEFTAVEVQSDPSVPSPDRYVDAVFGETGYLSRAFAGYTPRPGQVALARAVDRAIVTKKHLLAEGPTGTGKSLAYAAPASYHAAHTGSPVVICTANIALQEQIVQKDLPLLQKVVPWKFTFALLKGRNNYLCTDQFFDYQARYAAQRAHPEGNAEERRQLPIVHEWARATLYGEVQGDGDVSELPFEPLSSVWRRFSTTSNDCKKDKCRYKDQCYANHALALARNSHVIVTNYHLLFAHVGVYLDTSFDLVMPGFETVILDEAHKAADIARDFFCDRVTKHVVQRLAKRLHDPVLTGQLIAGADSFFNAMAGLKRNRERYHARLIGPYQSHEIYAYAQLKAALGQGYTHLDTRAKMLGLQWKDARNAGAKSRAEDLADQLGRAENDRDRMLEVLQHLTAAIETPNAGRRVYFLDEDEKQTVSVSSKLIQPKEFLTPGLFEKEIAVRGPDGEVDRGGNVTVIVTSATLATEGKNPFEFIAGELGVEAYDTLIAESPFRWNEQCLFVVPEGMPEPNDPLYKEAVARIVERAVLLGQGRTLSLHTSRRVLDHTYDAIASTCRKQGYTLLKQGDEPRTKLIARFKADIHSVLLGTESFWAGVDVPGEACSIVVIDRLPFATPEDPVLAVISANDDNWFFNYSIPRAIIQFKQGFGRLVRSQACRGVVVCCDPRLLTKRYKTQFLRALPAQVPKSTNLDSIAEWLNPPAWDAP